MKPQQIRDEEVQSGLSDVYSSLILPRALANQRDASFDFNYQKHVIYEDPIIEQERKIQSFSTCTTSTLLSVLKKGKRQDEENQL